MKYPHMLRMSILLITVISGFTLTTPIFALTLHEAKAQGLVGEQPNGYIGLIDGNTPELSDLINTVNAKRQLYYQKIAIHDDSSLSTVENVAGETAISLTPKGYYIRDADGDWVKKP